VAVDLVQIGRIIGPHGVGGHVKVVAAGDTEGLFQAPDIWSIGYDPESVISRRVESSRVHVSARGRSLIVRLDGISTRTAAEMLKGAAVFVGADEFANLHPTEEVVDLTGYSVVRTEAGLVGTVVEVRGMPAQDLLIVARTGGEEVMIPWVPAFVVDVDHDQKKIRVDLPEGLVD
jgi:16S rRNA processing protein RimM